MLFQTILRRPLNGSSRYDDDVALYLSLSLSVFLLSVFLARKEGEEAETGRGGT